MPAGDGWRTGGQLAVSIVCWLALAAAVAWNVSGRAIQILGFGLVLLFSLSIWITQWDPLLLSESLSVSLAAAVLAAWLALVRAPSWWTVGAVLGTTLLWVFVRDTNPYVALLSVPFVLAWAALRRPRARALALAAGLLAISLAGVAAQGSTSAAPRRELPLDHVVATRVLTDPGELRYFRSHGMPFPAPLRALHGRNPGRDALRPYGRLGTDPRLAGFHRWVRDHGPRTLASYLVTHPYRMLKPVVDDSRQLFEGRGQGDLVEYRSSGDDPLLPGPVEAVVYPRSLAALLGWLALVVAAAAWLARLDRGRAVWLVPAVAVVLQIPHAAVAWQGDAFEIPRHSLLVGVSTRLGLLVLSILLIDAALDRPRSAQ